MEQLKQEKIVEKKSKLGDENKDEKNDALLSSLKIVIRTLCLPEIKGKMSYKNLSIIYAAILKINEFYGLNLEEI
jgi:hypothetical protein